MDSHKILFLVAILFAMSYIPGCAHVLVDTHYDMSVRCLQYGPVGSIPLFALDTDGQPLCLDFPWSPDNIFIVSLYVWWPYDSQWDYVPRTIHSSQIGANGIENCRSIELLTKTNI